MPKFIIPQERVISGTKPIGINSAANALTAATGIGRAQQSAGASLVGLGAQYLEQANKAIEDGIVQNAYGKALTEFNDQSMQRMSQQLDKDGNPLFPTLAQDIDKIGQDITSNHASKMMSPRARQKFLSMMDNVRTNKVIAAQNQARQQQQSFSLGSLQNFINKTSEEALRDDPVNMGQHVFQINEEINSAVASGLITAQKGEQMKRGVEDNIRTSKFNIMAQENPEALQQLLEASDSKELGISETEYSRLNNRVRISLDAKQRRDAQIEKERQQQVTAMQNENAINLELALRTGKAGGSEIDLAKEQGYISNKQHLDLFKKFQSINGQNTKTFRTREEIIDKAHAGQALFSYTNKQITDAYNTTVAQLSKNDGSQITLLDKAKHALTYKGPNSGITDDMLGNLHSGKLNGQIAKLLTSNTSLASSGTSSRGYSFLNSARLSLSTSGVFLSFNSLYSAMICATGCLLIRICLDKYAKSTESFLAKASSAIGLCSFKRSYASIASLTC